MNTSGRSQRFPPLRPSALSQPQKAAAEKILGFSLNGLKGPHNMLLRSPEAAELSQALGQYLRFRTGIADRILEFAILVHARLWSDSYEWTLHAPRAAAAGLTTETVEALRMGRAPPQLPDEQEAIFRFSLELERDRRVCDSTFDTAIRHFGERGVADLTLLLGQYATISMVLAVSEAGDICETMLPAIEFPFADYPRS